ncbi:hypothetical protein SYNPS1DRAFT_27585 [Syncephalis pseudoplumigaleata]|uniref:G-protein coupled receptors family 3 profile domain-containing protein n=1 Tax=Syncephalis pseudoplumigaleata TaxID=1712513 RepID=A0A4P9Z2Y8_9FUNG|nr:hypothetical protein SYNPS1DRAFT_27585 [Syncephalis pseudoplumigaleata]|eukprot:RKP26738.1 hypothetical protein SYNPS1DRAFT_27585 [Syncephalis pseudoplumigaleata]
MGELASTEWEEGAPRVLGIPLHPSGERNILDYVLVGSDEIQHVRMRMQGLYRQLVLNILISAVFLFNFNRAIRMMRTRWKTLPSWCCLLPSLCGVLIGILAVASLFPPSISCRTAAWYVGFAVTFSLMCNSVIVLQKAYLALCRPRWVLVVGVLFMLPQLGFMYVSWLVSPVTLEEDSGCTIHYPHFLPFYWFGSTMPLNILFSGIFSYIAYKQYQSFGSEAWMRMARDGIQTMCLVVLCNIMCATVLVFHVGGHLSNMFFAIDYMITTTILVHHCYQLRELAGESKRASKNSLSHQRANAPPSHYSAHDSRQIEPTDHEWMAIALLTTKPALPASSK